jgi:hypothetical protein
MVRERTIRKIAINDKRVFVDHVNHIIADDAIFNQEIALTSDMKPHRDFFDAFQKLKTHAVNICELAVFKDDKKVLERHVVTTLSIIDNMDSRQIKISINKYTSKGTVFSVTTPLIHLQEEDYQELPQLVELIDTLENEANAFVDGKKHGENLLFDSDGNAAQPSEEELTSGDAVSPPEDSEPADRAPKKKARKKTKPKEEVAA